MPEILPYAPPGSRFKRKKKVKYNRTLQVSVQKKHIGPLRYLFLKKYILETILNFWFLRTLATLLKNISEYRLLKHCNDIPN